MKITPVILSGGSGTRLWPLSRAQYPKQFLALTSKFTLIQETVKRLDGIEINCPIVVCNEQHRFIVAEQLNAIGINASIILEPVGKNTAPAIATAAFSALKNDNDSILLVLAADHVIKDVSALQKAIKFATLQAQKNSLVTFGIKPTSPETGYGYIKADINKITNGVCPLNSFVEKPNLDTAKKYLASGDYFWNSGMFVFKANTYLAELKKYSAEIYTSAEQAFNKAVVDADFIRLDKPSFESSPSNSIDYAVMENTDKGMVVPLDAGWNDVGSWLALWEVNAKDKDENVIIGDVIAKDVKSSYIYSENRLVTALGIDDLVIVDTKDTVLIAKKNAVQDVKKIVEELKKQKRSVATENRMGFRPWGCYDSIEKGDRFKVKHITVKPGGKLSVQMHYHRAEHWVVVSGTAKVRNGDKELVLAENESTFIPLGTVHALENPGKVPLELIEVQSGTYLEEDDIVRFEDRYGRC